jgi:hypothetical protein
MRSDKTQMPWFYMNFERLTPRYMYLVRVVQCVRWIIDSITPPPLIKGYRVEKQYFNRQNNDMLYS